MSDRSTIRSSDANTGASRHGGGHAGLVLLFAPDLSSLKNVYMLGREQLRIGRSEENDIALPDETVSRRHAELVLTDNGWVVRDLKSRNGTLADGRRVRAAMLTDGSIVRFGDVIFKFVGREAELRAAYLPDGTMRGSAVRQGSKDSLLVGGIETDRLAFALGKVAKTDLSVLALGESGTGKELIAQEIHRLSGRSGRLCAVNCAAIPANLLESELFGHKKGAFSGAVRDKPGLFHTAHEGTLLLDEIGDMPLDSQAKLLRVLQAREVTPVGGLEPEPVDVRIVAATHQDLEAMQEKGRFRQDLYARLSDFVVRIPPLRDRKEDILALCLTFLRRLGRAEVHLSVGFMAALLHYDWPYNVRELESCIKRSVALLDGDTLRRRHLPDSVLNACQGYGKSEESIPPGLARTRSGPPPADGPSEDELRALLTMHQGNITAVARALGKARMQVHRWLARYSIDPQTYRPSSADDET